MKDYKKESLVDFFFAILVITAVLTACGMCMSVF